MLVAPPGGAPVLLDFMVEVGAHVGERAPLDAVVIDFGDAVQVFHIGASSCGTYGVPAGVAEAAARFGSIPLPELAAPAIAAARDGVVVNREQALLWDMLAPIAKATPESRARYGLPREGETMRDPELADGIERLALRGRGAVLHRRHRVRRVGLGARARRDADARGPRRVRGDRPRPDPRPLPRPRGADEPAAERGRRADRLRARAAGARRRPARRGRAGGRDGGRAGRAHRRLPRGPRRARLPGSLHVLAARLDHPHLGDGRRRLGVQRHHHQRRGLGDRRARHRHPRQQHARRAGPLARAAGSPTRPGAGCRR